jgi:hypothetical protein
MAYPPRTYQFSGVPFSPRAGDLIPQLEQGALQFSARHVPYSSFNVIDLGGLAERRFKAQIRLTPANAPVFVGLLGTTGEIVINGTSFLGGTLVSLSNHTVTPRLEWHFYDAEWVVSDHVDD